MEILLQFCNLYESGMVSDATPISKLMALELYENVIVKNIDNLKDYDIFNNIENKDLMQHFIKFISNQVDF